MNIPRTSTQDKKMIPKMSGCLGRVGYPRQKDNTPFRGVSSSWVNVLGYTGPLFRIFFLGTPLWAMATGSIPATLENWHNEAPRHWVMALEPEALRRSGKRRTETGRHSTNGDAVRCWAYREPKRAYRAFWRVSFECLSEYLMFMRSKHP